MEQETKKSLTERLRHTRKDEADSIISDLNEADELAGSKQLILCRCGDIFVSFHITDVKELVASGELNITFLPSLKEPNVGIVRRKGELIALASMASVIGAGHGYVSSPSGRAVICHTEVKEKSHSFGLLVDEVIAVMAVENDSLSSVSQKVTESVTGGAGSFQQIFQYEEKEYRIIDTPSLYRFLMGTIERRNVLE